MLLKGIRFNRKILFLSLMLAPVAVFFINLAVFSVNIPYNDDYDTVYGFMFKYLDAKTWLDRFNLLTGFWNDHRETFNKLITLLQYSIFGRIDVRLMQFIGNSGLIIIAASLYRMFSPKTDKIMLFVPAVFLFFQTGYSENSFFGMASLTNFYVMAFGYLSILLLNEKYSSWGWIVPAFFLSCAAYFTQANGILFLGTGLFLLLFRKEWKKSVLWIALSIPVIIFYRCYSGNFAAWDFGKLAGTGPSGFNLLYFFYFIGNCFGASSAGYLSANGGNLVQSLSRIIPLIAGIAVTAYFIFITAVRYYRKNPALYAVFLFLMLSALGAAAVRGTDLGMSQAITSRYRVVSVQFIMLIYLTLSELPEITARVRWFFPACLALSIIFCGLVYYLKFEPVRRHRSDLELSLRNWEASGRGLYPLAYQWNDSADRVLAGAVKRGLYRIPREF